MGPLLTWNHVYNGFSWNHCLSTFTSLLLYTCRMVFVLLLSWRGMNTSGLLLATIYYLKSQKTSPPLWSLYIPISKLHRKLAILYMSDFDKLSDLETFWRDHQKWLQHHGYMLRQRFSPDWVPSWNATHLPPLRCEDGINLRVWFVKLSHTGRITQLVPIQSGHIVCDAKRVSDGADVVLKIIRLNVHPHEVDIGQFLSSVPDPKNKCVPIYEVLVVPDADNTVLIVMPLLRPWNNPPFQTIGETVDFFGQLFEVVLEWHFC